MRYLVFCISLFFITGCYPKERTLAPVNDYGLYGGADSAGVHTVTKGDTLWSVSKRYGLVMQDVIYVNKLEPPYYLDVGERLRLPPPETYRVRGGDTLYDVAKIFNVSISKMARLNDLKSPYVIGDGNILKIPSSRSRSQRIADTIKGKIDNRHKPSVINGTVKHAQSRLAGRMPKRAGGKFKWPVNGNIISRYGVKEDGLHNDGINIEAARGTPVAAAENGIVVYTGNELKGYGNLVLIRHGDRWVTAYAHMDHIKIKRGQEVKKGQAIGTVGSSGNVSSPQLHFEVRRGTEALDPGKHMGS
jgi:murein DD-endopeptidase MepM/ murein hydrolase activator NlpD